MYKFSYLWKRIVGDDKMKKYLILAFLCLGLVGCNQDDQVSRDTAQETALEEVDGEVVDYTENFDDDEPHHLFTIANGNTHYEVKVHRDTGEVISSEVLDDNEGIDQSNSTND